MSAEQVKVPLAEKHRGMRVNARGMLTSTGSFHKFGCEEMAGHLEEVARRYYAGDVAAVDEFLQLYCLGEEERKKAVERQQGEARQ